MKPTKRTEDKSATTRAIPVEIFRHTLTITEFSLDRELVDNGMLVMNHDTASTVYADASDQVRLHPLAWPLAQRVARGAAGLSSEEPEAVILCGKSLVISCDSIDCKDTETSVLLIIAEIFGVARDEVQVNYLDDARYRVSKSIYVRTLAELAKSLMPPQ